MTSVVRIIFCIAAFTIIIIIIIIIIMYWKDVVVVVVRPPCNENFTAFSNFFKISTLRKGK